MATRRSNQEEKGELEGSREALLRTVLAISGAEGYREISIEQLLAASGVSRREFREHFIDLEDCYATAYEDWTAGFVQGLLAHCSQEAAWPTRFRLAMEWLVRYTKEDVTLARGAIAEAAAAGERVQAVREGLVERLCEAVDAARLEADPDRHSPPPVTAAFVVGAISCSVRAALGGAEPESLDEQAPDLLFLAVMPFFGEEAAWTERAALEGVL
jgi:AcrR family transcriptional regulator